MANHRPINLAPTAKLQRGLSLIELMISITIGLIILAALSTLFVNQSKTRVELDKANRMIDNGRYTLETLSDNLKMAGYYGEFSPTTGVSAVPAIPTTLPDPCSTTAASISAALQLAVQGYDAGTATSQIASPPCSLTYTAGSDFTLKPGSDILVIRRASNATSIVPAAAVAGTHYIQVSLCQYDAVPYVLSTNSADFTLRKTACTLASTALANLRNFFVQVYFVSPNNNTNPADGIPTLKRRELISGGFVITPLVEGIEYMQVEYGLDANNDGVPDSYVAAPAATDWPNVVAVKVYILARNTEPTQGYTDTKTYSLGPYAGTVTPDSTNNTYKRHAYTQFIRLDNPAGRRE